MGRYVKKQKTGKPDVTKEAGVGRGDYKPTEQEIALVQRQQDRRKLRAPSPKIKLQGQDGRTAQIAPDHPDPVVWQVIVQETFGTTDWAFADRLLNDALNAVWRDPDQLIEEREANAALAVIHGVQPRDEIEAMLAAQMYATHRAAMDCLRRAQLTEQTFEGRDMNLKHATKLTRTYTAQMEALNRHRGKGQQKVTVEHVHVHQGGQAIVGHVQSGRTGGAGGERKDEEQPRALAHAPESTMPCPDPEREAVPVASGPGAEAVPNARGQIARRTEGQ